MASELSDSCSSGHQNPQQWPPHGPWGNIPPSDACLSHGCVEVSLCPFFASSFFIEGSTRTSPEALPKPLLLCELFGRIIVFKLVNLTMLREHQKCVITVDIHETRGLRKVEPDLSEIIPTQHVTVSLGTQTFKTLTRPSVRSPPSASRHSLRQRHQLMTRTSDSRSKATLSILRAISLTLSLIMSTLFQPVRSVA